MYSVTVRVTDDGTPSLDDFETFDITVAEVNQTPVLAAIGNQSIVAGSLLTFTAAASDVDLPANNLSFSLGSGAPVGATIDPSSGQFSWTPPAGTGNHTVIIRVSDDGLPSRTASVSVVLSSDLSAEINVVGNERSIVDGDMAPDLLDHTNFGAFEVDGEVIRRTYRIENIGIATLNLSGSPRVEISGANAGDFTVTLHPPESIDVGQSREFSVEFDPGGDGLRTATISIQINGDDENPYEFNIQGTGTSGETLELANLGRSGITIQSNLDTAGVVGPDGQLGQSVSIVGDVNGDAYDDILLGAPQSLVAGRAYLIFGGPNLLETIDLENLGSAGVLITAAIPTNPDTNRGAVGYSVSGAGDVNNDGLDDLIIGGPNGRGGPIDESSSGEAFIFYGRATWPETLSLDESNNDADVTLFGAGGNEKTGWSVSSAGDVNNDNFDDVIIGAPGPGVGTESSPGKSYIVYGGDSLPAVIQLGSLGAAGVTIVGEDPDDNAGWSVSNAGDVDGDNFDDVIIGARNAGDEFAFNSWAGASYIVFGSHSLPESIDLSNPGSNAVILPGLDGDDRSGSTVSGAGDINGDGLDDVLIAAPGAEGPQNSRPSAGEVYVVFGRDRANWPAVLDLSTLSNGITIFGRDTGGAFGNALTRAGDLNRDNRDDLVIQGGNPVPQTFILFGVTSSPSLIDLAVTRANVMILDTVPVFENHLGGTGDINNDGFDDLLIGTPWAERLASNTGSEGEVHVLYQLSPRDPLDINRDGRVSTLDALAIINRISRMLANEDESVAGSLDPELYEYDANRDGHVSVLDALLVINHLSTTTPEGESTETSVLPALEADAPTLAGALDDDLIRMLAADNLLAGRADAFTER